MSKQNFEQFQQHVAQTSDLQEQLKQVTNREDFVALVVQLGIENGYDFTAEEVEDAIATSQASTRQTGELDDEQLATVAGGAFGAGVRSESQTPSQFAKISIALPIGTNPVGDKLEDLAVKFLATKNYNILNCRVTPGKNQN